MAEQVKVKAGDEQQEDGKVMNRAETRAKTTRRDQHSVSQVD